MPPPLTLIFFFLNLFTNISVFSLFHALLCLSPPFPSLFSPSLENNQNRRLSFQSLLNFYVSISLFFSPTLQSLFPQPNRYVFPQPNRYGKQEMGMGFQQRRMRTTTSGFRRTSGYSHNEIR